MTVVNPKSISGINSITTGSGSDNLLTIHTSDASNTERLRIDSTGATKIVTGIVTTLTATTGIVTTLTTNTLTANSTTKVGSGITVSPDGDIFATGVTTATTFVGALTGNVTGTLQTAAQTNITSVGSLSSLVVTGGITATGGNVVMNDSSGSSANRIKLGTSQDLSVYHDGTDSIISNATGDLYINNTGGSSDDVHIQAADDILLRPQGGENGIKVIGDGSVVLYHDSIEKFSTQSYGIIVDGVASFTKDAADDTTSTLQINGAAMNSDDYLYIMSASNNSINGLTMFLNGSTRGSDGGNSGLTIRNDNGPMNVGLNGATHSNFFYTGAAGGIDFSGDGNAGGMTSELLDDYEEGTWTPTTPSGGGGWASVSGATYKKIGNVVFLAFYGGLASQSSNNALKVGGFPYAAAGSNHYAYLYGRVEGYASSDAVWQVTTGSTDATFFHNNSLVGYNNFSANAYVLFSGFYFAA